MFNVLLIIINFVSFKMVLFDYIVIYRERLLVIFYFYYFCNCYIFIVYLEYYV